MKLYLNRKKILLEILFLTFSLIFVIDSGEHNQNSNQAVTTDFCPNDNNNNNNNDDEIILMKNCTIADNYVDNYKKFISKQDNILNFRNGTGGIILFVHIPKSGGTTIRRNLQDLENIHYIVGRNYSVYNQSLPIIEEAFHYGTSSIRSRNNNNNNNNINHDENNNKNVLLFLELHAMDSPHLYGLRNRLRRWRNTAQQNNVPIFFFTLIRDPIPYAISHFNFFHVLKRNKSFEQCNATEENLIRLSIDNPQCRFLFGGERAMRARKGQIQVSTRTCNDVYSILQDTMDWIGTTETLSTTTLPLLSFLLHLPSNFTFVNHRVTQAEDESTKLLYVNDLKPSTLDILRDLSSLDSMLYSRVKQDYNIIFNDITMMWSER